MCEQWAGLRWLWYEEIKMSEWIHVCGSLCCRQNAAPVIKSCHCACGGDTVTWTAHPSVPNFQHGSGRLFVSLVSRLDVAALICFFSTNMPLVSRPTQLWLTLTLMWHLALRWRSSPSSRNIQHRPLKKRRKKPAKAELCGRYISVCLAQNRGV